MTQGTLLAARKVTRTIGGAIPVTLVRDIDLDIPAGSFDVITGPSGSGKSSLLYLLGLLDTPTSGDITINGKPTADLSRDALADMRLAKFGFVFQFHFLLPEFSALDNVALPMRKQAALSESETLVRAASLLADLGLEAHARKFPDQLSGGERQRVAIARALANDPPIVLADEPTGNLDSRNASLVFDIFRRLADEQKRTVIAVTHDSQLADRAHRRIRLRDGQIERIDQ